MRINILSCTYFLLAISFSVKAQFPYQSVFVNRVSYFNLATSIANHTDFAFRSDSLAQSGTIEVLFPYKQIENSYSFCFGANIFGKEIILNDSLEKFIIDTDTFSINKNLQLGDSSIFYTYPNHFYISLKFNSVLSGNVLSQSDSVRKYSLSIYDSLNVHVLSSTDTLSIQISKSHGIVQFINLADIHNSGFILNGITGVYLTGITNPDLGFVKTDAYDVFNFDIGDEFQYTHFSAFGPMPIRSVYWSKKVLDKTYTSFDSSFHYTWQRDSLQFDFNNGNIISTIFTHDTISRTIQLSLFSFLNGLPFTFYPDAFDNGKILTSSGPFCDSTTIRMQGLFYIDTLTNCLAQYFYDNVVDVWIYEKGKGLVHSYPSDYPSNGLRMVYYKKGNESCGTPINFAQLLGTIDLTIQNSIQIFPNPSQDEITIEFSTGITPQQIIITDEFGREIKKFNTQKSITQLDIQSLASGIYFLKIQIQNGNIEVRKFVKE